MDVVEVDVVEFQFTQTLLTGRAHILRVMVRSPELKIDKIGP